MEPSTPARYLATLEQIPWPEHAVVLADEALPASILEALPDPICVPAGEGLKRLARVEALAERVLARRSSRPLLIGAVGGGSIGDAIGFLASTLWRGVELWHVPTTLVAMVDSAHGGKTAVNLGAAKNQLGTFHEAARVWIVSDVLATLPLPQREEGLAELIKGLWLGAPEALDALDGRVAQELAEAPFALVQEPLVALLRRAVEVKYEIVAQDPREERGIRTFLNLGHTVAHALELEFGLAHGAAVAWGLATCARASACRGQFDPSQAQRLFAHIEPLLRPITGLLDRLDEERFTALVRRDKKRVAQTLRSVLLDGPGQPRVTRELDASDWLEDLRAVYRSWRHASASLNWSRPRARTVRLEASKSELNRALLISHLRPGPTAIDGSSQADDVVRLRVALDELIAAGDGPARVHGGLGGTTFRFLLAACARRPAPSIVEAAPRLLERPHQPLFDAIAALGGQVTPIEGGVRVEPAGRLRGQRVPVRCDRSSQYASALAMLAAGGGELTLELVTDERGGFDPEAVASRTYLEMTLAMLERAGVTVARPSPRLLVLRGERVEAPCQLTAHPDESSAAVWRVAAWLGAPVALEGMPETSWQVDHELPGLLARLAEAAADEVVEIPLHRAPDLAPVLTAAAALSEPGLRITRAAHLRHKESNRIDDLVAAWRAVGVTIEPRSDGLYIPPGRQRPEAGARWPVFEDHRLAMTGALAALAVSPLTIEEPWAVAKSYPSFWQDVRAAGGALTSEALTDGDLEG